jgi:hypothetical protein
VKKNLVTKNEKGSRKPIFSKNWRDRFQVDLVDFPKLRKRDPFGVLMRWVMSLKDHASRLTYLCALPRKRPKLVAYKLQEIFGLIGYPRIFHTDNGKEFTVKMILEFLRKLNPNILALTGRPRRPRDQGSVENVNALVKSVLGSVLTERHQSGDNPNWTKVLGSVASVINSQCGRGENDVTPYEAVFGQKFDHRFSCNKAEARRCWTIDYQMHVTNEPDFDDYVKDNFILQEDEKEEHSEDDSNNDDNEEDLAYWSDDDLSEEEKRLVSDEYFNDHLFDDVEFGDSGVNDSEVKIPSLPEFIHPVPQSQLKSPPEYIHPSNLKSPPENKNNQPDFFMMSLMWIKGQLRIKLINLPPHSHLWKSLTARLAYALVQTVLSDAS